MEKQNGLAGQVAEGMNGVMRCPACHTVPDIKRETVMGNRRIVVICLKHGHMAMGSNLAQAIEYWNIYVTFVRKDQGAVA